MSIPEPNVILGESDSVRRLRALIDSVAPTAHTVLIHGPSGSGKELVAQALHRSSGRSGSLVGVNVCAVPDTMFESMLFGHVKGAFTGATGDSEGFLREANGGTVFLDEISGLPMVSQGKLLRAVDTRSFRPVGARSDRYSDFRLLAATNEHLGSLASSGRFRADLLHRLGTIVIEVPSLCERAGDIPILAMHFAKQASVSTRREPADLTACALRALEAYHWPGNVRQLRNVIECASIMTPSRRIDRLVVEGVLRTQDWLLESEGQIRRDRDVPKIPADIGPAAADSVRRRYIALLEAHSWRVEQTAAAIGMHRATLSRHLREFGIDAASSRRAARLEIASARESAGRRTS